MRIKLELKALIKRVFDRPHNINNRKKQDLFYMFYNGHCTCCQKEVNFISNNQWLRDNFKCSNCGCIPRERALMHVIKEQYSNWMDLDIHESSPGNRGHSLLLKSKAKNYTTSHFFSGYNLGEIVKGFRNEDLENQTFKDEVFDIVVTSDVMEHIYDPEKAFKEIHRTLKPGGAHIFSVPIINKHKPTQKWAEKGDDGAPIFLYEPEWHGNPIDSKGSPVTYHWGYDIKDFIENHTGASCEIIYLNDLSLGIRAEYIEIVVAKKSL